MLPISHLGYQQLTLVIGNNLPLTARLAPFSDSIEGGRASSPGGAPGLQNR